MVDIARGERVERDVEAALGPGDEREHPGGREGRRPGEKHILHRTFRSVHTNRQHSGGGAATFAGGWPD